MAEDFQTLQREVGQLSLRIDSLEKENEDLKKRIPTSEEIRNLMQNLMASSRVEIDKDLDKKISQADEETRRQILDEVAKDLKRLADDTNVQLDKLARAIGNTPPPHSVSVGPTTPVDPARYEKGFAYQVKHGESLSMLAKRFNVQVNDIRQASHLQNDGLKEGQSLWIPSKTGAPPTASSSTSSSVSTVTAAPSTSPTTPAATSTGAVLNFQN